MEVTPGASGDGARNEVERLAEEFTGRLRRGERPTIEEYEALHPRLAAKIRELFTTLLFVEELGIDSEPTGVAPASRVSTPAAELKQIGEYRILREIGRGGMGIVYEAEQESLGRRVALKVLPFHFLLDSRRLERFQQEARAAARLSHPNIVPVYGVGEHLGIHYYVMQLIPGQGLNRVIEAVRNQRQAGGSDGDTAIDSSSSLAAGLGSGESTAGRSRYFLNAARLARDAALALDYAHGHGVLHRDVKPSNLLLDPTGRVWLTDFGLAKAEGSDELTHSGDFVGTVLYMAPERFKGWSDPRSDVYGLGITLRELLTLRPVFSERDRAQLLRKVATEEPPAPRRVEPNIPRDLETVVLRAIAKEPSQRYASARAMAQDLDRFLEGLPVEARRSQVLSRLGRWCARNRWLSVFAATTLLLLAVVAVVSSTMAARLLVERAAGQETLRGAFLAGASALRASVRPGHRFEALEALRKAIKIRPGPELVDEALACFALVDLRPIKSWPRKRIAEAFALSPDGSVFVQEGQGGEIVFRSAEDGRDLDRIPAPGFQASHTWAKFSRNGKLLLVRQEEGEKCQWRVWDHDRRRTCLEVKDAPHQDVADFAPDQRWIVLGTRERSLRIFDLATGTAIEEFGRGLEVECVAVHPGARLIAFSSERTLAVHVWDRESGRILRSLPGIERQPFKDIAWHPDGRSLAAASFDHRVYVWNADTGERSRILLGHLGEVTNVSFHAEGRLLVSSGWDPAVKFWDSSSDQPILSIPEIRGYFSRDTSWCWTVASDHLEQWEMAIPPAFTLLGHDAGIGKSGMVSKHPHSIGLAPGGRLAATCGDDGVRLWDLASSQEILKFESDKVYSVLFDPSGRNLISSGTRGLETWPLRPLNEQSTRIAVGPARQLTQIEDCQRAALGNEGRTIAAIHDRSHAHVLDPFEPEHVTSLKGLPGEWYCLAVSQDGAWAATGTAQGEEAGLWNLRDRNSDTDREPVQKLPAPRAEVAFHPASTHLATCTPQRLTLWRLGETKPVWQIDREPGLWNRGVLAFNEDGTIVAFTHNDSRIWLIETTSGKKLSELEASERLLINALAFAGGRLAASTPGRRFHIWDLSGLAREVTSLGLNWQVQTTGGSLTDLSPLHATLVERSIDIFRDKMPDLAPRQLFRPLERAAFLPELVAFADVDRALASPSLLIAEGETWRFFRGRGEPSAAMEWTNRDFDDARWETGRSPLTGSSEPPSPEATFINDQLGSYSTLYLRHAFEVPEPKAISRLVLAVEIEDGFVAYFNGQEVGRFCAGKPLERLAFQTLARQTARSRTTQTIEIKPALLETGRNVLALQALTYSLDSRVHLLPVLAAVQVANADRDQLRTQNLVAGPDGAPDPSIQAYREGRILQRAGRTAEALARFRRANELDRGAAEPLLRELACYRDLGELDLAESRARTAIEQGEILEDDRLWRAWITTAMVDLKRTPTEALASIPKDPRPAAISAASNYRWLLEQLAARAVLRINCGGDDHTGADGKPWSRDRFFLGGAAFDPNPSSKEKAAADSHDDKPVHGTDRWFSAGPGVFSRGYSIPIPPGRYRVSLHFFEATHHLPGRRVFDVFLEDDLVLECHDPALAGFTVLDLRAFEVEVTDGALDVDFLSHKDSPRISALEAELIGG